MSQDSADLIAQHAVLIQPWQNFLDMLEADQKRLQQEMQAAELVVPLPEAEAVADPAAAPEAAEAPPEAEAVADPAAAPEAAEAPPEAADPVAWLRGGPAFPSKNNGETPVVESPVTADVPEAATWLDEETSAASGFAPAPAEPAPSVLPPVGVVTAPSMPAAAPDGAAATPVAPSGGREQALASPPPSASVQRGTHDAVLGMFEADFGGAVSQEFGRALAEADETQLPYSLRETMQVGQSPEEVAAAFVRAERAGELPPHLEAAVRDMEEVDYHFRDVGERLDSPTTDDDPNEYF